jgi:hypothetical protein
MEAWMLLRNAVDLKGDLPELQCLVLHVILPEY